MIIDCKAKCSGYCTHCIRCGVEPKRINTTCPLCMKCCMKVHMSEL